jgi:hypothetical protein
MRDSRTTKGETPLHGTEQWKRIKSRWSGAFLAILGAKDVSLEDADGTRALDIALRHGLDDITALLNSVSPVG